MKRKLSIKLACKVDLALSTLGQQLFEKLDWCLQGCRVPLCCSHLIIIFAVSYIIEEILIYNYIFFIYIRREILH